MCSKEEETNNINTLRQVINSVHDFYINLHIYIA